jgi:hypothetical protein
MAKRRTKEQIAADKIIKRKLLDLGEKVLEKSVPMSRRDTGRLQDEQNFRVYGDTTLRMAQMYYGAFNYPEGKTSGEKNALVIAIKEEIPPATKVIVSDITSKILDPFKK